MLTIERCADEAIISLLEENIIGTPGKGMVYQHTKIQRKVNHIREAYFASIRRNDKVISTICFVCREQNNLNYFYIRFFTFKDIFRRKVKKEYSVKLSKKRGVKMEFDPLLQGKLFDNYNTERNIIYSYIDPSNLRSMEMAEGFGFNTIRSFSTFLFSRLKPNKKTKVRQIASDEIDAMKSLLSKEYDNYNFFTFDNLFIDDSYFVLEDNGDIVAGLQVHKEIWKVLDLPGASGKLMLNVISRIPVLKKLFNRQYRFLAIEGIYSTEGCEDKLEELLESVLFLTGYNTAMLPVDMDSELLVKTSNINFGLLNRLHRPVKISVVAKFNGISDEEIISYYKQPVYISGYDIS